MRHREVEELRKTRIEEELACGPVAGGGERDLRSTEVFAMQAFVVG
jgi:hypothetical protein